MSNEQNNKQSTERGGAIGKPAVMASPVILHPASRSVVVESCAVYHCLQPAIGLWQDLENGVSIPYCKKHMEGDGWELDWP